MHCEWANDSKCCNGNVRKADRSLICSNHFVVWNARAQMETRNYHYSFDIHSSVGHTSEEQLHNLCVCVLARDYDARFMANNTHTIDSTEDIIVQFFFSPCTEQASITAWIAVKWKTLKMLTTNRNAQHFRNKMITKKVNATALTTNDNWYTQNTLDTCAERISRHIILYADSFTLKSITNHTSNAETS